jgi:two-component system sensor histidine kinase/response regulator
LKRILVVDDEPAITRLIKLNLESDGAYEVLTENKGSQAIEAIRRHRPDLVLLDIMMPDKLGSEIAAELQEDPQLRDIKIIFLTAMLRKAEAEAALHKIGNQLMIAKPVSKDELITAIEESLA